MARAAAGEDPNYGTASALALTRSNCPITSADGGDVSSATVIAAGIAATTMVSIRRRCSPSSTGARSAKAGNTSIAQPLVVDELALSADMKLLIHRSAST